MRQHDRVFSSAPSDNEVASITRTVQPASDAPSHAGILDGNGAQMPQAQTARNANTLINALIKTSGGSRLSGTLQKRIHLVRFKRARSNGRRTENERRRSVQTNGARLIQIGVNERHDLG